MKNVIITGGTGFIGKNLKRKISQRFPSCGVQAIGSDDVDLSDRQATFRWFEKNRWTRQCDHIIHLAALYKAGDWPVHHQATQFYVNMSINVNLLEAWRIFYPAAKLTSVLSYCLYPPTSEPHKESEIYGSEPEDYLFAYAYTKKCQLIGQKAYFREYGLKSTSVALPTVYGPGDSFHENSHVIGALVGKFVRAARAGLEKVEVWGDGMQEREFLFVEDASDGILAAALKAEHEFLNLGTGKSHRICDVAAKIARLSKFDGEIVQNTAMFTGVACRVLDVNLMRKSLGWSAQIEIEQGLEHTIAAYQSDLASGKEFL
jgi:GDP-L-fucose synthase